LGTAGAVEACPDDGRAFRAASTLLAADGSVIPGGIVALARATGFFSVRTDDEGIECGLRDVRLFSGI
jgi:hypothetical protein